MDHNESSSSHQRRAFLTIFLTLLVLGFFLFVLIFISGGFFLYVLLFGGAMIFVGLLHYLLWGRAFSSEVAGECEEERLRQRAAELTENDWHAPDTRFRR
jgi:hypothetical protein